MIQKPAEDMGKAPARDSRSICDDMLIALRRIIRSIDLHSKHLVKEFGLTGPQVIILQEISRGGYISASELAQAISLSQATVTGILDRLEKRELILRKRSDHDRRRVLVEITADGKRLLETAPPPMQERFTEHFVGLEKWEQYMILSSLNRIVAMMGAGEIEAAPILTTESMEPPAPSNEAMSSAKNIAIRRLKKTA